MAQLQNTSITGTLTATSITASVGFSGNGFNLTNVTASSIINFVRDVVGANNTAFDIQQFTTTGSNSWVKPSSLISGSFDPKMTMIICVGAGGGGGRGANAITSSIP